MLQKNSAQRIRQKEKLNSLKDSVMEFIGIESLNTSIWERKRDKILIDLKKILDKGIQKIEINTEEDSI